MATLKEIMAAKAKAAQPPSPTSAGEGGKGVVISGKSATAGISGKPIRLPPPPTLPSVPEPRTLGDTTPGPDVPFEFASEKNSEAAKDWMLARQATDTALGVWVEPGNPEMAWIAVESPAEPGRLLLLYRLPLLNRQTEGNPY